MKSIYPERGGGNPHDRAEVSRRLLFLAERRDGVIHRRRKSLHKLEVRKKGTQIQLVFFEGPNGEIQSRLDLRDPLHLVSPYTQTMMLGLLWKPVLDRAYLIGFGAGRVPMVLQGHFPELEFDCSETDEDVVEVAQKFFGISLNANLRVHVKDGRKFLRDKAAGKPYDIIIVDAFDGTGGSPFHLGTKEFYTDCRRHLADDGVVVVNMFLSDALLGDKVRTLTASFAHVQGVTTGGWGGCIFFATNGEDLSKTEILERAVCLQDQQAFSFSLLEHARRLKSGTILEALGTSVEATKVLSDDEPPAASMLYDVRLKNAGRNDPCPCGSGKKFKKCHGMTTN